MKTSRTVVCDICGKVVNAQGIGGHKKIKHGFVEKVTVNIGSTQVGNTGSTQVNAGSTQVGNTGSTQVNAGSTQVGNTGSTQVRRPCDYIKKREVVIKRTKIFHTEMPFGKMVTCCQCGRRVKFNELYCVIRDVPGNPNKREVDLDCCWCRKCNDK